MKTPWSSSREDKPEPNDTGWLSRRPSHSFELIQIWPRENGKGSIHAGIEHYNSSCIGVVGCGPSHNIDGMIWFMINRKTAIELHDNVSKGISTTLGGSWKFGATATKYIWINFETNDLAILEKALAAIIGKLDNY